MTENLIPSAKKTVRIISSDKVIRKTCKLPVPVLSITCNSFLIYSAIIDYPHGQHFSIGVHYTELVDSSEYLADCKSAAVALAKVAKKAGIKKIVLTNVVLNPEEKLFFEALKKCF